jgi:hypothetical protein
VEVDKGNSRLVARRPRVRHRHGDRGAGARSIATASKCEHATSAANKRRRDCNSVLEDGIAEHALIIGNRACRAALADRGVAHLAISKDVQMMKLAGDRRSTRNPGVRSSSSWRPSDKAHTADTTEIARQFQLNDAYVRRLLRFAYLAPDIVEAIVQGHQPRSMTVKRLLQGVPCVWADQRAAFGFAR